MSKPKVILSVQHPVSQRLIAAFSDPKLYEVSFDANGDVCIFTTVIIQHEINMLSAALKGSGVCYFISSRIDGAFSLCIRFFQ